MRRTITLLQAEKEIFHQLELAFAAADLCSQIHILGSYIFWIVGISGSSIATEYLDCLVTLLALCRWQTDHIDVSEGVRETSCNCVGSQALQEAMVSQSCLTTLTSAMFTWVRSFRVAENFEGMETRAELVLLDHAMHGNGRGGS